MHALFTILSIIIALLSILASQLNFSLNNSFGAPKSEIMTTHRAIRKAFHAIEQNEGVGARVRRSIGGRQLPELSPFLMLDHFSSTSLNGFPDHPHRGQGQQVLKSLVLSRRLTEGI